MENIRKTDEKNYFNKKVCVINKLVWMFCKNDGINCYCYQRDGELCQGNVMGMGFPVGSTVCDPSLIRLEYGFG